MKLKSNLNRRVVSFEKANDFAKQKGFEYFEVSAKNYINVDEIFIKISEILIQKIESGEIPTEGEPGIKIGELEQSLLNQMKTKNLSQIQGRNSCC